MKKIILFCCFLIMAATTAAADDGLANIPYFKLIDQDQYFSKRNDQYKNLHEATAARDKREKAFAAPKEIALLNASKFSSISTIEKKPDGTMTAIRADNPKPGHYLVPSDTSAKQESGMYLVASAIKGSGQGGAKVIYLPKACVVHLNKGDNIRRDVDQRHTFVDEPSVIPLEIGNVPDKRMMFGQRPLREYRMQVKFRGNPLPNSAVTITTESGWKQELYTDRNGRITVEPFERKLRQGRITETYLYSCSHTEPQTGITYVATLPVIVTEASPEWENAAHGYIIWMTLSIGILFAVIFAGYIRRKNLMSKSLVAMKNYPDRTSGE